jgi:hypothetical protein
MDRAHFMHSSIHQWTLVLFPFGTVMSGAAMNVHVQVLCDYAFPIFLSANPGVKWLNHRATLCLTVFCSSCTAFHSHQHSLTVVLISSHHFELFKANFSKWKVTRYNSNIFISSILQSYALQHVYSVKTAAEYQPLTMPLVGLLENQWNVHKLYGPLPGS